jgi:hypothetical protein
MTETLANKACTPVVIQGADRHNRRDNHFSRQKAMPYPSCRPSNRDDWNFPDDSVLSHLPKDGLHFPI